MPKRNKNMKYKDGYLCGEEELEQLPVEILEDVIIRIHRDCYLSRDSKRDLLKTYLVVRKWKLDKAFQYTEENLRRLREMNELMKDYPLDVIFICIGENGHLAFNDPPADFDARDPYIQVELERRSKRQQVGEGWFSTIDEVPNKAITMSVFEILTARHIICACPDQRKAKAVASCIFDDISPSSPAASIRRRTECALYLDRQSSCLVFDDFRMH